MEIAVIVLCILIYACTGHEQPSSPSGWIQTRGWRIKSKN
jgi:hypothetical protein